MTSRPHLPLATEYREPDALQDVRDSELLKMKAECASWSAEMALFRQSLLTPAALVLWRVLIANETEMVAEAVHVVSEEISDRKSNAAADAVPALGEDLGTLEGDETKNSNDGQTANR